MSEFKDLNELLKIARNINEGKYDIVDVMADPESDLYDIARYFNDSLKKLQTASNTVSKTYDDIPTFERVLSSVIDDSREATESVFASFDNLNFNVDSIKDNLELLRQFVESGDFTRANGMVDRVLANAESGKEVCLDVFSALAFRERTRANIEASLEVVSSLEDRLASLLIKLGIKQNVIDVNVLDKMKDTKEILQDQDLVNKLLKEFGV